MAEEQDELEILVEMHEALVDLLKKKGLINEKEYEKEVKHRLEESKGLTRFEDLKE
jgi:hypothetical protein